MQNGPSALIVGNKTPEKDPNWYVDCGATDTMSHDAKDIVGTVPTSRTHIATANGGLASVVRVGNVGISPKLQLKCLYVPSLSQVTKELNCRVLMYSGFCFLQDIHTQEIIRRGTEQRGLYVVDEVVQRGAAQLANGTSDR